MQFGGVFWQTFRGFQASSHAFDQLLSNENTGLHEVLDDDNVIQELKNQNSKLIEYLNRDRVLQLIGFITVYPSEEADHKTGHKFPFIASELFSCETSSLLDMFFEDTTLLNSLFQYLNHEESISILDGYFSKLVLSLLTKNPPALISYIISNNIHKILCLKITSKSLSDIISKLLILDLPISEPLAFVDFRKSILIELINQIQSSEANRALFSAAVIVEFISKAPDMFAWKEMFGLILSQDGTKILKEAAASTESFQVSCSVSIIKALISSNVKQELMKVQRSEEDSTIIEEEETSEFSKLIISIIPDLILTFSQESQHFIGTAQVPVLILGEHRLKIVEFFVCCVKSEIKEILNKLLDEKTFEVLTDAFFKFDQNSILHSLYDQFATKALIEVANQEDTLKGLIERSKILQRLSSGCENKGYSGYAIKIGSLLKRLADRSDTFSKYLNENDDWNEFFNGFYTKKSEQEKKTLGEISSGLKDEQSSEENNFNPDEQTEKVKESLANYLKNATNKEASPEEVDDEFERDDNPMNLDELSKEPGPEDESPEKRAKKDDDRFDDALRENEEEKGNERQPDEEPKDYEVKPVDDSVPNTRYGEDEEVYGGKEVEEIRVVSDSEYWMFG